jgi:glycine/D-amino acid oxidase-like deaminating enzyme
MKSVHTLIIGQGLAGTCLAWTLHRRGISFYIVDNANENSSSRVAAGLITPVTGMRAVKTWNWQTAIQAAKQLYRSTESLLGTTFFEDRIGLRLFESNDERRRVEERLREAPDATIEAYDEKRQATDSQLYENGFGGFEMQSSRLDTVRFVQHSSEYFQKLGCFSRCEFDIHQDVDRGRARLLIPRLGLEADFLALALGTRDTAAHQTWFPGFRLSAVHGDILTLAIENFCETRTIHRGIWLTPTSNKHYLLGATYRRDGSNGRPSPEGQIELVGKLGTWLKRPFEVVSHRAAMRPGTFDQKPLLGNSPIDSRIWLLNGLGGKGSLYAPLMAEYVFKGLLDEASIPQELQWNRRSDR